MREALARALRRRLVRLVADGIDRVARIGRNAPPDVIAPRRILVVKPCCLGDLLMATPALRALAGRYPDADIDVLSGAWSSPALAGNPHVSDVLEYPAPPTTPAMVRLISDLRRGGYELGIGLDRSPLVNAVLWLAGIPVRAGIDSQCRGVALTWRVVPDPGQHETDLFLEVVRQAGAPAAGREPEYVVDAAARCSAEEVVPSGGGPLVVIHPGGAVNPGTSMPSKRWPPESFAALAARAVRELAARVVLVGARSDREAAARVEQTTDVPVTNLCERLDLPLLAAVIALADGYVGNDSGVGHLAAAVGTPTITIFGPTSPRRYRPLGPRSRVCAPPASWQQSDDIDLRHHPGPSTEAEIAQVLPDEVFNTLCELLALRAAGETR